MQIRRAILITFLSSNFNTALLLMVSLVVARFVTPQDIGVFSIAVVCINVIGVFRDLGTDVYLQQMRTLTSAAIGAVLGMTLTSAFALGAVLVLTAPFSESFFGAPGMYHVLLVLTASFLLVPYASMLSALFARHMQAERQALVNFLGTLAFAVTVLTLAQAGWGAMSMAWANFANLFTSLVAYLLLRPPGVELRPRWEGWGEPLRVGVGAMLGSLARVCHQGMPDVMLGRLQGPHEVGLFSRANGLVSIFQQAISPAIQATAVPALARQHHGEGPVAAALLKGVSYLTVLGWPVLAFIALMPELVLRTLYGQAWVEAAPLVLPLSIAFAVRAGFQLLSPGFMAIGRAYLGAAMLWGSLFVRVLAVLIWGQEDLLSFVWALALADAVVVPVQTWMARHYLALSARGLLREHLHSFAVTLVCCSGVLALLRWGPLSTGDPRLLPVAAVLLAILWLAAVFAFRHPVAEELRRLLPVRWVRFASDAGNKNRS